MSAWLKAGLIGGAILFVLDLIGQIPIICCCIPLLMLIVYIVVGVMAASYILPPRDTGKAAGQGALAASLNAFVHIQALRDAIPDNYTASDDFGF